MFVGRAAVEPGDSRPPPGRARSRSEQGEARTQYERRFGFRHFACAVDRGFFLNGAHRYLRGVNDVAHQFLDDFDAEEGVLFIGRAQERATVFRTEKRRDAAGKGYPWIVKTTGMVNQVYFYCVDSDFGPFFLKFCSYFPYNAKLCLNGHEWAKRQAAKEGIGFTPLDNAFAAVDDPGQRIPRTHRYQLTPTGHEQALFLTRVHDRLIRTGLADLADPDRPTPLRTATRAYDKALDDYLRRAGLTA